MAGDILKQVSRSFYITLRLLPKRVRPPISLAYLLARTSDTIADTESVPVSERLTFLQHFHRAVHHAEAGEALQAQLKDRFQPLQSNHGETKLLDHTADAVRWLGTISEFERDAMRDVLREILRGQSLDCERFGEPGTLRFLSAAHLLEEYTDLVAGSVGVFWTRLCFHHWEKFAREPEARMSSWAKSYGRALQLINILRDLPRDLEKGRCYLPVEGALDGQRPKPPALMAASRQWEKRCADQLGEAMHYCQAVRPARLRYATVLPLLLAERTLAYLRPASWEMRERGIKVSRNEVNRLMKRASLVNLTPKRLVNLAADLRRV